MIRRLLPTCDDADAPALKGVIHAVTAALYVVMLAYHVAAALGHFVGALRDIKIGGSG